MIQKWVFGFETRSADDSDVQVARRCTRSLPPAGGMECVRVVEEGFPCEAARALWDDSKVAKPLEGVAVVELERRAGLRPLDDKTVCRGMAGVPAAAGGTRVSEEALENGGVFLLGWNDGRIKVARRLW